LKTPKSILIVGADSNIGRNLYSMFLADTAFAVFGTSRKSTSEYGFVLDLADQNLDRQISLLPKVDIVIYCAAMTIIAECESDPEMCIRVNFHQYRKLIDHFSTNKTQQILLSTNRVFSGQKPCVEYDSEKDATTTYGLSKALIEDYIQSNVSNYTIIRMTKVIFASVALFESLLSQCKAQKTTVFSNLSLSPISIFYVLSVVKKLVEKPHNGVIQLSGRDDVTYYHALIFLCKALDLKLNNIVPIQGEINEVLFGKYTTLDMSKNPLWLRTPQTLNQGFEDFLRHNSV
jgi:dTDP-4-dehydrorhamnose reductase